MYRCRSMHYYLYLVHPVHLLNQQGKGFLLKLAHLGRLGIDFPLFIFIFTFNLLSKVRLELSYQWWVFRSTNPLTHFNSPYFLT